MPKRYRHNPNPALRTKGHVSQAKIETLSLDFGESIVSTLDEDDIEIRARWRTLINNDLPNASASHLDWPIYLNHCFARVLLDNAVDQYWRDVIQSPAWKNTPLPVLQTAIDLGEAILEGSADIWRLNDASLIMRSKAPRGRIAAVRKQPTRRRKTWLIFIG